MARKSAKSEESAEPVESRPSVPAPAVSAAARAPAKDVDPAFPEPPPRVERSRYVPDGNMTVYDELVGDPSNPYSTMW